MMGAVLNELARRSLLDRLLQAPLPGTALAHLADALGTLRRSAAARASGPAAGGGASKRS